MIEIKNLKKSFGKNVILQDVSLRVEKGDAIVILGSSGAGKTTLLRCLNFLEKADGGEMDIGNLHIDFASASKKQILEIRRKVAFVFQNYNLFNNKTAIENVMEGLIIGQKMPKAQAREIAEDCLNKVGLSDKYDSYPSQLSGGQQQRVGIARAMALNPEVILFDEPTSALDPELVGETLQLIRKIAKEGITMVIVTHELEFAQDVANKVIFMEGGFVVEEGTPEEIFTNPKEERTRKFLDRILSKNNMYYI